MHSSSLDSCLILLLGALPAIALAAPVKVELSPSYEATREMNGDVVLVVTVSAKAHMVGGAVELGVPLDSFLEQAAKKECPQGYSLQSQDPLKTHVTFGVSSWTQRSVVRCHGT